MDYRALLDLTFPCPKGTALFVDVDCNLAAWGAEPSVDASIQAALTGDPAGYRQLYRLHVNRVNRLIRRLVGHGQDCEDVIQVVFVQAFQALPTFRSESSFATWLSRIAIRVALRHTNRYRPSLSGIDENHPDTHLSPEAGLEARRALDAFQGILSRLSEKRRTAFVLHVLEGHSMEEIAEMLGTKVGAIKVRVHDARLEIEKQARREPSLRLYLGWKEAP